MIEWILQQQNQQNLKSKTRGKNRTSYLIYSWKCIRLSAFLFCIFMFNRAHFMYILGFWYDIVARSYRLPFCGMSLSLHAYAFPFEWREKKILSAHFDRSKCEAMRIIILEFNSFCKVKSTTENVDALAQFLTISLTPPPPDPDPDPLSHIYRFWAGHLVYIFVDVNVVATVKSILDPDANRNWLFLCVPFIYTFCRSECFIGCV